MSSTNKWVGVGRLTKDPQLKFTPGQGTAVANFSMAVNRKFKKQGQPDADFFNVVAWGKIGESVANYKKKGDIVAVVGRIETRSYEGKSGKVYVTEVIAEEIDFVGGGNSNSSSNQGIPQGYFGEEDNQDMPF
jgi:single-strand DNA-binding protein